MVLKELVKKEIVIVIFISVISYLVFFYPVLDSDIVVGGSDAVRYFYPSRYYLYEKLVGGEYPFWTERIFSGFPIYADVGRAFLNPVNILSILLFGPFLSYKILHVSFYFVGSLGLYYFLKNYKIDFFGFFVANSIYYFSFFHLYHQQHFDIVLVTYLIPFNLLLTHLFLERKKLKYLILSSFVVILSIYFGSLQAAGLMFVSQLLLLLLSFDRKVFAHLVLFLGMVLTLSLPLLTPAYGLFKTSSRYDEGTSYTDGSFPPFMAINLFYPFFFGIDEGYKGIMVSDEFHIHETYMYVGISSIVLASLGFVYMEKSKFKKLLVYMIIVFLLLGFLGYIPILRFLNFPIISSFRYWGRSVVLFNFAVACFAGFFVSNIGKLKKFSRKPLKFLLIPIVYLGILGLFNIFNEKTKVFIRLVLGGVFNFDMYFIFWLIILFIICVYLFFVFRAKLDKNSLVKYFFCVLVVADIIFFGTVVIKNYFRHLDDVYIPRVYDVPRLLKNRRIIEVTDKLSWNLGLYYPSWGIFGYSQFAPANYTEHLKSLGFKGNKKLLVGHDLSYVTKDFLNSTEILGVYALVNGYKITEISEGKADLVQLNDTLAVKYIIKKEGHIIMLVSALENERVQTLIRNYDGWDLEVDGKKRRFANDSGDLYLSFDLSSGSHVVELNYVPKGLYMGASLGMLSGILLVVGFLLLKRKNLIYEFK